MKSRDRNLGMDRAISRRDLLHGMGALAAGALCTPPNQMFALENTGAAGYPPALTGFRGSHVGSFEVAHQLARTGRRDWGTVQGTDDDIYDLLVVGGGLSGLAAAHFFLKQRPKARILILDNHDDFGGHARRNEFQVGGRTLIGYGGNQSLEAPSGYSDVVKGLLRDLGVDTKRFDTAYDQEFYKRHGLAAGIYFNRRDWGVDRLVLFDLGSFESFLPLAPSPLRPKEAMAQMPISQAARREFLRLLVTRKDQIPEIPPEAKEEYLYTLSYRDFLSKHLNIREPQVFAVLQDLTTDSGVGIEATPACDNAMIPYLCPELPAPQREALSLQVKTPMLYTTVALRNWQAWKKLGLGGAVAPGSYHINAMLDFPVSLGDYSFAKDPDDPIAVHMERFPHRSNEGLTLREQNRIGRREMLSTSFETIERHIRSQLAGMLGSGGFDPARDIEGITVNRWPHGYSYTWYNPLFDPVYEEDDDERYPHIRARKRFGRIAIANADAGANAMFETAVEQGHRAVTELT